VTAGLSHARRRIRQALAGSGIGGASLGVEQARRDDAEDLVVDLEGALALGFGVAGRGEGEGIVRVDAGNIDEGLDAVRM
jgi:hypothetical protein